MGYKPKLCIACGVEFHPAAPVQKYCSSCGKEQRQLYLRQHYLENREAKAERRRQGQTGYKPKLCIACGAEFKPTMGRQKCCPSCSKDRPRQYYRENREAISERHQQWYVNNREAHNEQMREWYQANRAAHLTRTKLRYSTKREEILQWGREYRRKNGEALRARRKELYEANREAHQEYQFQYRQKKKITAAQKRLKNLAAQKRWRETNPGYTRRHRERG